MQDTALALKAFSWSLEKIDILIAKYWVGQKVKLGKNTIRCYGKTQMNFWPTNITQCV